MSQDARQYAAESGGMTMIYPPAMGPVPEGFSNVWPERQLLESSNTRLIAGLKEIFGSWRWPSNG